MKAILDTEVTSIHSLSVIQASPHKPPLELRHTHKKKKKIGFQRKIGKLDLTGCDDGATLLALLTELFGLAPDVADDGNTRQSIRHGALNTCEE